MQPEVGFGRKRNMRCCYTRLLWWVDACHPFAALTHGGVARAELCSSVCTVLQRHDGESGQGTESARRCDGKSHAPHRTTPLVTPWRHRCPAPTLLCCGASRRRLDAHHMWRATCAGPPACSRALAVATRCMPGTGVSVPVTRRCRCVTVAGVRGPRAATLMPLYMLRLQDRRVWSQRPRPRCFIPAPSLSCVSTAPPRNGGIPAVRPRHLRLVGSRQCESAAAAVTLLLIVLIVAALPAASAAAVPFAAPRVITSSAMGAMLDPLTWMAMAI